MATFESCWRELRAEFPLAGPLLCRNWVQEGFTRACDQHGWAFLRGGTGGADGSTITFTITSGTTLNADNDYVAFNNFTGLYAARQPTSLVMLGAKVTAVDESGAKKVPGFIKAVVVEVQEPYTGEHTFSRVRRYAVRRENGNISAWYEGFELVFAE